MSFWINQDFWIRPHKDFMLTEQIGLFNLVILQQSIKPFLYLLLRTLENLFQIIIILG